MKTPFVNLKNIDSKVIDQKYNFVSYKEKNKNGKKNVVSKTKISDITKENMKSSYFSFIDEAKNDHICILTMKDIILDEQLPKKTEIHCFWCRHGFTHRPIGCPISFKNTRLYKKYYSEITKNNYCLQETITTKQLEDSRENKNENYYNLEIQPSNYYTTDGIFCSFNCCYSFIEYNKTNPMYNQSLNLLKKMYFDLFPDYDVNLMMAPHWRLLKTFGGDLSIEEFRKNFYKVEYIENNDFTTIFPHQKSMGLIFEKRIKL